LVTTSIEPVLPATLTTLLNNYITVAILIQIVNSDSTLFISTRIIHFKCICLRRNLLLLQPHDPLRHHLHPYLYLFHLQISPPTAPIQILTLFFPTSRFFCPFKFRFSYYCSSTLFLFFFIFSFFFFFFFFFMRSTRVFIFYGDVLNC
jgi:hypothetical protein